MLVMPLFFVYLRGYAVMHKMLTLGEAFTCKRFQISAEV